MNKRSRKSVRKSRLSSPGLAVNGGKPVRSRPWSAGPFHFREEARALEKLLSGPSLPLAMSKGVLDFRSRIRKLYGARHAVTTSSGTTAIHVALAAAGVQPGDEVITSPITDYGSVIGIFQLDAIPVFCDCMKEGLLMDAGKIEALITPRTKVIMPVHTGGYCADMEAIMKIARRHKIKVIEDCAQAHFTKIGSVYAGCHGDFGCFSTNESKHMKTGEGGFIICRNSKDAKYADLFADKCYPRFPGAPRTPAFPALNVRMSEVNAVLGIEQIKKLPSWIRKRRAAGTAMEKILRKYPLVPHWRPDNSKCSYWWFAFLTDEKKTKVTNRELAGALTAEGIPSSIGLRMLSEAAVFAKLDKNPSAFPTYRPGRLKKGFYSPAKFPGAKWVNSNIIKIPLNQHTGESELRDFKKALEKIFSRTSG